MLKALHDLGHEPECSAYYGLDGGLVEYDGYRVWPCSPFDPWGNDVIKTHILNIGPEAIITLMDLFVLNEKVWEQLPVPWIAWTPIDHEEIGPATLRRLQLANVPVAMSDFGAVEMMKAGIEEVIRIYHAVDTDVFKPMDKYECREAYGLSEDAYIIGMVMANKGDRKQFPRQFKAIKMWMDKNPDRDVRIFLHTEPSERMGGWKMKDLVEHSGLSGKVHSTRAFFTSVVPLPSEDMAKVYNCFDVLLNVSAGEGFGIPIIEAQACGVPVIAGNYTAMGELVHNGYLVEAESRYLASHFGYQFLPSLDDLVYRLESAYRMCDKKTAQFGRSWVEENCSVPVIAKQWNELLGYLQEAQAAGYSPSEAVDERELTTSIHS